MASPAAVHACQRLGIGGAVIPGYLQDALLRRRSVARVNRTPLPVLVMHPKFIDWLIGKLEDTTGNAPPDLPRRKGATLFGFVLRADATVPFGEWWYE